MIRSEAIGHLKNIAIYSVQDGYTDEARQALDMAIKALEEPERKKGKWITEVKHYKDESQDFYYEHTCCSICGTKKRIGWYDAKYCPRCGADMRGE